METIITHGLLITLEVFDSDLMKLTNRFWRRDEIITGMNCSKDIRDSTLLLRKSHMH